MNGYSGAELSLVGIDALYAEGVSLMLSGQCRVSIETISLQDILDGSHDRCPEIIVTEASSDLPDLMAALRAKFPTVRVMALARSFEQSVFADFLRNGGDGYLLTSAGSGELRTALAAIVAGGRYFPNDLAALLVTEKPSPKRTLEAAGLSAREIEILGCLCQGMSNKHIAIELDIQEATAKVHVKNLLRKIGVNNRTQAAVWGLDRGMRAA